MAERSRRRTPSDDRYRLDREFGYGRCLADLSRFEEASVVLQAAYECRVGSVAADVWRATEVLEVLEQISGE